MPFSYGFPLDPGCPVANSFFEALWDDPMTAYSGVGDEVAADFESRHRGQCVRCQEYGAANVEVVGP